MKSLIVLLVLIYSVGQDFDREAFLASAKAAGIKLQADSPTDSPHGELMLSNGRLAITLYEKPVAMKRNARRPEVSQPGRAVLEGKLGGYRATIDKLISASDPK